MARYREGICCDYRRGEGSKVRVSRSIGYVLYGIYEQVKVP